MRIRNTLAAAVTNDQMREQEWDVIPSQPHSAHMHMALDEVLLESVRAGRRRSTLRLWKWIEPALVIGSHQSVINEVDVVAARELGFVVTRRMSGGGTMLCQPARTITYSLYLPESIVAGITFRKSYALLDDWAVRAFVELGIPAGYREINDIISPRGKIGGAAQARRRGFVLHHTTIAHSMEVGLLPRLIRIGRPSIAQIGVRSAEKAVSPLAWFTSLSCEDVARSMEGYFSGEFHVHPGEVTREEVLAAEHMVSTKYATPAWINRIT
jgi:lipoate-protein ligase A